METEDQVSQSPEPSCRTIRSYQGNRASDNARVHYGDIYSNYYVNISAVEDMSYEGGTNGPPTDTASRSPTLLQQPVQASRKSRYDTRNSLLGRALSCNCRRHKSRQRWYVYLFEFWRNIEMIHEDHCPYSRAIREVTAFGMRVLLPLPPRIGRHKLAIDVTLSSTTPPFSLVCQRIMPDSHEAFELFNLWDNWHWKLSSAKTVTRILQDARRKLSTMLMGGLVYPRDVLDDGSTLLHRTIRLLLYLSAFHTDDDDQDLYKEALLLVQDMIASGVPASEFTNDGELALDFVLGWYDKLKSPVRQKKHHLFQQQLLHLLIRSCYPAVESSECLDVWDLAVFLEDRELVDDFPVTGAQRATLWKSNTDLLEAMLHMPRITEALLSELTMATSVACASDWLQGLELLVARGMDLNWRHPHWLSAPLEQALKSASSACAVYLLRGPYPISHPSACLVAALAGDGLGKSSTHKPSITAVLVETLALRRKKLLRFAVSVLHGDEQKVIHDFDEGLNLDGERMRPIEAALRNMRVEIPSELQHQNYENIYTCVGDFNFDKRTADLLWSHGFRHLPAEEKILDRMFLLNSVYSTALQERITYVGRQLAIITWVQAHTVTDLLNSTNSEALLRLSTRIGVLITRRPWECDEPSEWRVELPESSLELIRNIFLTPHPDRHYCKCTDVGCTGLDRMLRAVVDLMCASAGRESVARSVDDVTRTTLHYLAVIFGNVLSGPGPSTDLLRERMIRFLLFTRLKLRHICCLVEPKTSMLMNLHRYPCVHENIHNESESNDEIKAEIAEEDKAENEHFEKLLQTLLLDLRASTMPLSLWLESTFEESAVKFSSMVDPHDETYAGAVRAAGVEVSM